MIPIAYSTASLLLMRKLSPSPDVYGESAYECSSSHNSRCKYRRSCRDVRIVDAATGDPPSHK